MGTIAIFVNLVHNGNRLTRIIVFVRTVKLTAVHWLVSLYDSLRAQKHPTERGCLDAVAKRELLFLPSIKSDPRHTASQSRYRISHPGLSVL
jgi:hypothetical protein